MRHVVTVCLLLLAGLLGATKLELKKFDGHRSQPRQHPLTELLNKQTDTAKNKRSANFQKLLVILVDFQEETSDDPNTTGNGKFFLQTDPSYLSTIGSPPHDHSYFQNNLEALRYYYLAASNGSYNLQYDIYPQSGGAYTLPHTMGYYNPPSAGSDLFVSRMEEYFKASFELADSSSPQIDFSQYDHFMIIHAGSDWQHDIQGDTPSDIPSFYITVGEGKEAVVDGGTVLIDNACNVPSTISQDYYTQSGDGGATFQGGYGALNAVLAHEFGHSVGMADLYNVYNFRPMVGVFDIMDSGGSGVMVDSLGVGQYVMVEGVLPVLPGAWSRAQAFGDFLQSNGNLRDLAQTELFSPLSLSASSFKQSGLANQMQILRIPLSSTEYLLVENRNVDPDGDGGTTVKATDDRRVVLYPTPNDDPTDSPSYEYDFLLPSFSKANGGYIGGGILAWRINNDVIYNQGVTNGEGNWYSNYENNTVNTDYFNRGVQIIEADNLADIGNELSWYWTGTQYEYFHKYKPTLNSQGYFVNWSQELWRPQLSSSSEPPLQDSHGVGSQYWLAGMGNPAANMTLTVRSGFFEHTQIEPLTNAETIVGPVINASFISPDIDYIPLISPDSLKLLTYEAGAWITHWEFDDFSSVPLDFPVVSADQNSNGYRELVLVHGNSLDVVEIAHDVLEISSLNYPAGEDVSSTPLCLRDTLYVSTGNNLSSIVNQTFYQNVYATGILRLAGYDDKLAALATRYLYLFSTGNLQITQVLELPETFGKYEPVVFQTLQEPISTMLFLMADSGNIYKYEHSQLSIIFHNTSPERPTQLGLTSLYDLGTANVPVLFWAAGSRVYAIKTDGTLLSGLPYDANPLVFTPEEHVYSLAFYPKSYLYLPVPGRGHIAFDPELNTVWDKSLLSNNTILGAHLYMQTSGPETNRLSWYYTDPGGDLYIHDAEQYYANFSLLWSGFRNGGTGSYTANEITDTPPADQTFSVLVYPNPVRQDVFRLRVNNFQSELKLDIFDINASLVQTIKIPANEYLVRDVQLDSSRLASGVYILSVESGGKRKRVKFAVEK